MQVPFVNLGAQFQLVEDELVSEFLRLGRSGQFILGEDVEKFERQLADFCETEYAISVANGTDALILVMKALNIGEGDEVITVPNSFIASAGAISVVGATPVFVDVGEDYNLDATKLEAAITPNTKAIVPVHLTGNPADIDAITDVIGDREIVVIEDAAQAIGATYRGKKVGSLGLAGGFSLHPLKNLSLLGDAGFISTNSESLYQSLKQLRNHGLENRDHSVQWSVNSRLDTVQAAFGNVKLAHLPKWTERFQAIAARYSEQLSDVVTCPKVRPEDCAVFHNYVIRTTEREALMGFLKARGVDTKIHYPIPLHLMDAASALGYKHGDFPETEKQSQEIMSLPIYPELTDEQVDYVCQQICGFFET